LIGADEHRRVAIVDPGDAAPVLDAIARDQLEPCAILATHHHGDHVGGVAELVSRFDIPVYGPAHEAIPSRTAALSEGDPVVLPDLPARFEVLDVPGHTAGHIAYFGEGMLFIGDTLFLCGCGRLFEGTAAQMFNSLAKIIRLPGQTRIYCAHEYTLANLRFALTVEPDNKQLQQRHAECSRLRETGMPTVPGMLSDELETNPFLRVTVPAIQAAADRHAGSTCPTPVDVFAAIRRWKDNF